jgi:hypothetical protein
MDGTSSGYYFQKANNITTINFSSSLPSPASVWIIYLEGGGWCWDEESCKSRCNTPSSPKSSSPLCSSKSWPSTMSLNGIFNAKNPTLQNANKIFVKYCTSDGHMGDTTVNGWNFRGARVIQNVLTELVEIHGLGQRSIKDTILFGGASAGGRGAMIHLDYVSKMLGSSIAKNIIVRGFLDSPLWINLPSINPSFPGFHVTCSDVFNRVNVTHTDEKCIRKYSNEPWKCIMGEYRMPFLQTPYFISASQDDLFQIYEDIGHAPIKPNEIEYASTFANLTRATLLNLHASNPSSHAVFSWACFNHAVSMSEDGFNVWKSGEDPNMSSTMNDGLVRFLGWGDSHSKLEWVDMCAGWKCGKGC